MKKIALLFIIVLSITSCKQKSIEERFTEALYMLDFKTVNKLLKKDDCCTFLKQNEAKFFSYLCKTEEEGSYDLADLLIKNGIDINLLYLNTDYENSDFVFANSKYYSFLSKCNSKEKAQLLISNGINIDIDCGNGITPLMQYIESGYIYRDSYNHTWGNNSKEIIKLLLKNGADVNHKLENGVTPLLIALQYQNREVVDLLLQYGAEIHEDYVHLILNPFRNTIFEDFGDKADYTFSELTSICNAGYVDLLKGYLENHKVNLFSHSGDGYDYFFCAVQSNNPEIVEYLLPYYGNINSKRYTIIDLDNKPTYGYTLYGVAHHFGCEKVAEVLLTHGADGFTHY